ncbi:recombinase family protein [Pedobacter sp. MC2016-24]|uniref:recombinase family protein n=1 Tax=Pedobacter sp. MC2016-24 TaxID=2780090 RepID=UPI00187DE0E9|nr:recombinase family protein [Pedobacter sp. MC2016-24]MBE9602657.1 recombinase family protein [Pedobacter sp. MC2016-24]
MTESYSDPSKNLVAKKAIILARVSSRDQEEGYSIDAQRHRLENYCSRRNLEILKTFEIVESSTNGDRDQFMGMLQFVTSQKETIAIVADKVDRVQRSFKEYPMLDSLIQKGKIELHFNTENYVIHKDSVSQERLMWSMGVVMAQSYVDCLKDNVKRSIDHKIRQGEWIAMAPLGYINVREGERGSLVIDEHRAHLVRRIFEEYATGTFTYQEMTNKTKTWGLKNRVGKKHYLPRTQVVRILNNPFYYGVMEIKGKLYDHKYPPIISKELFDYCQDVTAGRNIRPFTLCNGREYVFRGILTCGVSGHVVTADTKTKNYKNGSRGEWTYLRCFNPAKPEKRMWVREEKIIAQAASALKRLNISPDLLKVVISSVRETDKAEREFLQRQMSEFQREHSLLQNRLDKLMDLLLDGVISQKEFQNKKEKIREDQRDLESQIGKNRECDDSFKNALISLISGVSNAHTLFEGSTNEQKRQILNFVFANLTIQGSTLCFTYKTPFDLLLKVADDEKWLPLIDTMRTNMETRNSIILLHNISISNKILIS